jgi:hypothetical protein
MPRLRSVKDLLAGVIFVGIGLAFMYATLGYELGTALRMGPGYFPALLAGLLILLGVIIMVQSLLRETEQTPIGRFPLFGLVLVLGSLVFFGATVRGLGLAPALFCSVALSAYASRHTSVVGALILAAGLTLVCFVIFIWGLGLPLAPFGPWLRF